MKFRFEIAKDDPAAEELQSYIREYIREERPALLRGKKYLIRKGPEIEETSDRVILRVEGLQII
jgi:hypothetical protein